MKRVGVSRDPSGAISGWEEIWKLVELEDKERDEIVSFTNDHYSKKHPKATRGEEEGAEVKEDPDAETDVNEENKEEGGLIDMLEDPGNYIALKENDTCFILRHRM